MKKFPLQILNTEKNDGLHKQPTLKKLKKKNKQTKKPKKQNDCCIYPMHAIEWDPLQLASGDCLISDNYS